MADRKDLPPLVLDDLEELGQAPENSKKTAGPEDEGPKTLRGVAPDPNKQPEIEDSGPKTVRGVAPPGAARFDDVVDAVIRDGLGALEGAKTGAFEREVAFKSTPTALPGSMMEDEGGPKTMRAAVAPPGTNVFMSRFDGSDAAPKAAAPAPKGAEPSKPKTAAPAAKSPSP